jgi:hypothetical protein
MEPMKHVDRISRIADRYRMMILRPGLVIGIVRTLG